MKKNVDKKKALKALLQTLSSLILIQPSIALPPSSSLPLPGFRVVVNSNTDAAIQADDKLTLREAIEIVNGKLSIDRLSNIEKNLLQSNSGGSRIEFNLPVGQTVIELQQELPPLVTVGTVIDGTTQPGYNASASATAEIFIPKPIVTITPVENKEILRGLTVAADNIQIRGLNIYSFNSTSQTATLTLPPANIFIDSTRDDGGKPPKNIVIENNWLGLTGDEKVPEKLSAFGVYIFNSQGAKIYRNRISYHEGSGIITSKNADNTLILENIIVGNGVAGMPDAVRLEGTISNSQLKGNLICGNDGAGIYLFKPDGKVQIQDNRISLNGRRLRRAAVYLMGNNHQVLDNEIRYQTGPGVAVTAFSTVGGFGSAVGNTIKNNKFSNLEGLSIDLNTQQNLDVSDFQRGDGVNPPRNSGNRRLETANGSINAPTFASSELLLINGQTVISGKADPDTQVDIYKVGANQENNNGPLSELLATITTDKQGKFNLTLNSLKAGDKISAIATDSKYGTSEPAFNALIKAVDSSSIPSTAKPNREIIPQCVTKPKPKPEPTPEPTPEPIPEPTPEPLRLKVPRMIHFALDKSFISTRSAKVLDQVAEVLQQYPFIVIEIEGHTDPRASNAYNQALGRRRALSTRNYLLKKGIAPERMTIRSFGETKRRTTGSTRLDTARDRRAEIIFRDTRGVEIIIEEQENDLQLERSS